ncbi:hypothetical protein [Pseudomonas sp.]|uniref:hypothetical protein n=1 Tax=Pseudomonas sp. TaxID=306 RepID=UPI002587137F|nr:hypothetical protein [Pseudomonas sp.]
MKTTTTGGLLIDLHSRSKKLALPKSMRVLTAFVMMLIVSQAAADEQMIDVQHDSARGVTCWILNNTGISCLPDSSLLQAPTGTAADESQAARASLATSMCQSEQLHTTSRPPEKGFQL